MDQLRLDIALTRQQLFATREKARFAILKGAVCVNGKKMLKPGSFINPEDKIEVIADEVNPYVSKVGLKLKKAIDDFQLDFSAKTVLDIGASMGGFTDCALQQGAKKVFAVEVESSQLDDQVALNPAVVLLEDFGFHNLSMEHLAGQIPDIIISDWNSISLTLIMSHFVKFMNEFTQMVLLIKPQLEAGKEQLGNDGIVKNPKTHEKVIRNIEKAANKNGLAMIKLTNAPIFERKRNIEYLALFMKKQQTQPVYSLHLIEESFKYQKSLKK